MSGANFKNLSEEEKDWLDGYLDGTISAADFAAMQDRMVESPGFREVMRRYLLVDDFLRSGAEDAGSPWQAVDEEGRMPEKGAILRFPNMVQLGMAAAVAFVLGLTLMYVFSKPEAAVASGDPIKPSVKSFAEGFAVVESLMGATWPEGDAGHDEGDTLGTEVFRIAGGAAEIQFFSGATMTVEGPAEISLKSAWEAYCLEGAVRMQVPPAARGFILNSPSTEIVDLGTEFGLVVRGGEGHVEVFDGEIELTHRDEGTQLLTKGAARELQSDGPSVESASGTVDFPDSGRFQLHARDKRMGDFERWLEHRDAVSRDERLIAYYSFEREEQNPLVPNLGLPRDAELDGAVILAEPVDGRWPGLSSALEFRRPGARVRVNIPGEFSAYTFSCWVRIDSLDRMYSALFMGDGYENGEPHWQIEDSGRLMLSVMVDDTKTHPENDESRFHHVYYSPPIWDLSMSGEWIHLTSTFSPAKREVCHYVNGERISREEIKDLFFVEQLRIGNGEIGNWGQPFREDPSFTIRNLSGRMDELAIYGAALSEGEVRALFEGSRSRSR
ncbi:MAG: LamG-like jellyroll fold domain-containing protein [Verrucomicrobiaceae bacterium]